MVTVNATLARPVLSSKESQRRTENLVNRPNRPTEEPAKRQKREAHLAGEEEKKNSANYMEKDRKEEKELKEGALGKKSGWSCKESSGGLEGGSSKIEQEGGGQQMETLWKISAKGGGALLRG